MRRLLSAAPVAPAAVPAVPAVPKETKPVVPEDAWSSLEKEQLDLGSKGGQVIRTIVNRGNGGLGIDLKKKPGCAFGEAMIQNVKALPDGSPSPVATAVPSLQQGDYIRGVNGAACTSWTDVIHAIRGASDATIQIVVLRPLE